MVNRKRLCLTTLFITAISFTTYAQNKLTDSSSAYAVNKNINWYTLQRGNNLKLYNGIEYVFLYRTVKGFPFFLTDTFEKNNIVYDGTLYQEIPLSYDIVGNQVVTLTPDNYYIQLIPEKINSF